jgi:hypothetical protein
MSIQLFSNYNNHTPEIVINATKIASDDNSAEIYEFVLDLSLKVTASSYIKSVSQRKISLIENFQTCLKDQLFELNHVRVNPKLDNQLILHRFKKTLLKSGVDIKNPPDEILMAMCYRPMGELSDIVRFYLTDNNYLVFLSKAVKLSLV